MEIDAIPIARSTHVFVTFSPSAGMDLKGRVIAPEPMRENTGLTWPDIWKKKTGVVLEIPTTDDFLPLLGVDPSDLC
jgi:hypothetical protein